MAVDGRATAAEVPARAPRWHVLAAPPPVLVAVAVASAVVAVSTAAILIRLSSAPPLAIAFHRLLFATLALLPFALWKGSLPAVPRREMLLMAAVGLALALHFATWITSLTFTSVASSVVLVTFHPAIVGVVSHFWMRDPLRKTAVLGIGMAMLGALTLAAGDYGLPGGVLLGDALAFSGAAFAAAYFLAGRRLRQRHDLITYAFVVYAFASLFLLAMLLWSGGPLTGFPAEDYLLFAALALGPQLAGHTVMNWALRYTPATVISVAILGEPIGSTLLAVAILQETPAALTVLGGALILGGIFLVARERARGGKAVTRAS